MTPIRRHHLGVVGALGLVGAPASPAELSALVVPRRAPATLVDTNHGSRPFRVLRGGRTTVLGQPEAEFPALAADPRGRLVAAWDRPVPGTTATLTTDGPLVRHFAAGIVLRAAGPLVLDLDQTRARSRLRVLGRGAPRGSVQRVDGVRQLAASFAATEDLIAVAYVRRNRPVLATSKPGGTWFRRTLPGRRISGQPSVAIAGDTPIVVWAQRTRVGREILAFTGRRSPVRLSGRTDGSPPLVAAGPTGRAYAAWDGRRSRRPARLR